jgi:hypothetical protein
MHLAERTDEHLGDLFLVGRAHLDEVCVAHEDELASRAQEARRLGYPPVGVAPDRRSIFGEGEVKRSMGERDVLRVRLDELEPEAELLVHRARRVQLSGRDVDADDSGGAVLLQPRAEVGGAATQLDDVEAAQVGQDVKL